MRRSHTMEDLICQVEPNLLTFLGLASAASATLDFDCNYHWEQSLQEHGSDSRNRARTEKRSSDLMQGGIRPPETLSGL
jgi:hypothetical protein